MGRWIFNRALFALLVMASILYAEEPKGQDNAAPIEPGHEDHGNEKKWGIEPFAMPFYMPETSWGLGAVCVIYYRPEPYRKADQVEIEAAYTIRNQFEVSLRGDSYFLGEDLLVNVELKFRRFPDEFWGIGPHTSEDDEEGYNQVEISARPSVMYSLFQNCYAGPTLHYLYSRVSEREYGGRLIQERIPGSDGTDALGLGLTVIWDTRDSSFYPHQGFQSMARYLAYRKETGSEYNFSLWELDHRHFFRISGDHVLAFRALAVFSAGTVPWQLMPQVGHDIMRGYRSGRYRDRQFLALEGEYRFHLFWRFDGALFAGAGEVGPSLADFSFSDIRVIYGAGIRFTLDKDEHINIRFDVATHDLAEPNFYFTALEAF